jgi:Flp pilus assembly protein TadD
MNDANPTRSEVERQLERMLVHPLFAVREKQAEVFGFLVRSALDGRKIDQKDIRERCFPDPPYDPGISHARTNVNALRKTLPEYYAGDGKDDPVLITLPDPQKNKTASGKPIKLPPGKAYKPTFTYNPRHDIAQEFALAHHLLRSGGPSQVMAGLQHLDTLWEREPEHPDVILATVEGLSSCLLLEMPLDRPREEYIAAAFDTIDRLAKRVPETWRSHTARARLHFCTNDFDAAGKEFDVALALDREKTLYDGWYAYFLFMSGREEEAARLEGESANERIDDPIAQAAHGIALCKANRFVKAERAFKKAFELDRNCWPAHYGMTLLHLSTGNRERARSHTERLQSLLEPADFEIVMKRLNRLNPEPPAR